VRRVSQGPDHYPDMQQLGVSETLGSRRYGGSVHRSTERATEPVSSVSQRRAVRARDRTS
jgi:hypothetical protein